MLKLIGLTGWEGHYPSQLSGGQQQRVALARSLAIKPKILLLDEPLSALDAKIRVHLRTVIKKLQQELGITLIYVTHDQEEALSLADRVVIMRDGQIRQVGSPWEIYKEPKTSFIAEFVGTFLEGETTIIDISEKDFEKMGLKRGGKIKVYFPPDAFHVYTELFKKLV
jgi:putative spermidine/putrescine transport system ATP-binding protein